MQIAVFVRLKNRITLSREKVVILHKKKPDLRGFYKSDQPKLWKDQYYIETAERIINQLYLLFQFPVTGVVKTNTKGTRPGNDEYKNDLMEQKLGDSWAAS